MNRNVEAQLAENAPNWEAQALAEYDMGGQSEVRAWNG